MAIQTYEKYWSLTNAFTDYNGVGFLNTLEICINFIDKNSHLKFSENLYINLQDILVSKLNINHISVRKSINQLVKMGFINSFLNIYPIESKQYLEAKTNKKRATLLSQIVYKYSSLNSSVTEKNNEHQLNFLIQTLVENGSLTKEEIIALMLVDIKNHPTQFLNKSELDYYIKQAISINFINRKYNQIRYLLNLLRKLDGLKFVGDVLYFEEDAKRIFGSDFDDIKTRKRDPYLHSIYKNQLQEESLDKFNSSEPKCMLEELSYPVLIASHIKPFRCSDDFEAYDPNNGLLLSRTIDSLFDLNYITFDGYGNIVFSQKLSSDVVNFWKDYKLNPILLNSERLKYLEYHNSLLK
ncbi:hypothetical protein AAX29_00495 [Aliarcobacter thereius]|uniref:HNH nuclease domain-containing protein n=1 Tax=Aliarcobacter thereius TaxID=544718 RepID=A0A1C0BA87_9BACT|nr:HNH endonuclease signature motif containing protein [Aliarcobacter thereius]OCM00491.1 hypothetical protein AAX29_00495 [Aliarcobacter thereius]